MKSAFSYFASFYYQYIPKILNHMTILLTNFYQFPMIFCSMPHMESTESDHKTLNGKLHGTLWKQTKGRPMPPEDRIGRIQYIDLLAAMSTLIQDQVKPDLVYTVSDHLALFRSKLFASVRRKWRGDPIDYSSPLCYVVKPFKYFKEMSF